MHDHLVEFYESDPLLVESVSDFMCPALEYRDPVILVATEEHRIRFIEAIEARGIDVEAARKEGRFVDLDAAETLSRFMAGNSPDPELFEQVVGGLVGSTGNGTGKLRIYGEMVSLLWDEGNRAAALQLENLWNNLSSAHPFILLCAYPLSSINLGSNTAPFRGICSTHSSVRLRFEGAPPLEPNLHSVDPIDEMEPEDIAQIKDLGNELSALKEVIRNANQMGQLADCASTIKRSGADGLDYDLK